MRVSHNIKVGLWAGLAIATVFLALSLAYTVLCKITYSIIQNDIHKAHATVSRTYEEVDNYYKTVRFQKRAKRRTHYYIDLWVGDKTHTLVTTKAVVKKLHTGDKVTAYEYKNEYYLTEEKLIQGALGITEIVATVFQALGRSISALGILIVTIEVPQLVKQRLIEKDSRRNKENNKN